MILLLKLAFREIRNHPRFTLLFVGNLTLGLSGFLTMDAFRGALFSELEDRSRSVLAADLEISARRKLTPEELRVVQERLPREVRESRLLSLYSMAVGNGASRLVQLRVVDANYPLYGKIDLGESLPPLAGRAKAWAYPEVLSQLKIATGEKIRLGTSEFEVEATVRDDPQSLMAAASLAPRVYIATDQIERTGLVGKGSIVWYRYLYRFPRETDVQKVREEIFAALEDPEVQVVTHREASRQVARLLDYLTDYLGLVSLAALMLSGVGLAFLFRTYLAGRMKDMAILLSLGRTPAEVRRLFLTQVALLGFLGAVPAVLGASLLLPGASAFIERYLPVRLSLGVSSTSVLFACALGMGSSCLACLPLLRVVGEWRPVWLLREGSERPTSSSSRSVLPWVPVLVAFWGLSVWQARSFFVGSVFWGAFVGSAALLLALGWLCLHRLRRSAARDFALKLALRHLARRPFASLSCFLAISLGTVLVNVVFQIEASLQAEIEQPEASKAPSLFLFDIQEEQVEPLGDLLERQGTELSYLSPLVRARITHINGQSFDKGTGGKGLTREEEQEMRFRNRGFNLSYREHLFDSETLVEGKPFSGSYSGGTDPAEISVEEWFAEQLKLKLGDVLSFDIQGISVSGRITSLRKVRWSSFQPNFFVQFQPGVLEQAPKTFIAAVSGLSVSRKEQVQDAIVDSLSNVSMVDVSRVVAKIKEIVDQMLLSVQWMAALCLFVGYLVLFSIAVFQGRERRWDFNLMKILGGRFPELRNIFWWEFGLLGMVAAMTGAGIGLALGIFLSRVLFDGIWAVNVLAPVLTVPLTVLLCLGVANLAVSGVLRQRPRLLLEGG